MQDKKKKKKLVRFKKRGSIFVKIDSAPEKAAKASYVISQIIAKRVKPFTGAEHVKGCLNAVVEIACP